MLTVALKRALLLGMVLALLGPSSAHARPFGPVEEVAYQEAAAYWQATPTLCTSITKEVVPPDSLGVDEMGNDVGARATRPENPQPCGVWLEEDAVGLCTLMRHEYGHLLGYGHEDSELSAMPACAGETVRYIPTRKEDRREAWKLWRWARTECIAARGPYRSKCWRDLKREASHLRSRYEPMT